MPNDVDIHCQSLLNYISLIFLIDCTSAALATSISISSTTSPS